MTATLTIGTRITRSSSAYGTVNATVVASPFDDSPADMIAVQSDDGQVSLSYPDLWSLASSLSTLSADDILAQWRAEEGL